MAWSYLEVFWLRACSKAPRCRRSQQSYEPTDKSSLNDRTQHCNFTRGCVNDACSESAAFAVCQTSNKNWSGWFDRLSLKCLWCSMIAFPSAQFSQTFSLCSFPMMPQPGQVESNHDFNLQSPMCLASSFRKGKPRYWEPRWQCKQIAPSSGFWAVLDSRKTCNYKSPRLSTHKSLNLQYQYTSHTVLNCVGGTVVIAWPLSALYFYWDAIGRNIEPFMETKGPYILACFSSSTSWVAKKWRKKYYYFDDFQEVLVIEWHKYILDSRSRLARCRRHRWHWIL